MRRQRLQSNVNIFGIVDMPIEINVAVPQGKRMTSYNLLNGTHTANRHDLISTVLRKEWGFEGIVMTDWGTTNDKFNLGVYGSSSPALCIKAGNDLMMSGSKEDVEGILTGLKDGTITRAELEVCAGRILALSKELS